MALLPRFQSSGIAVATPQGQFRDVSAPLDQLSAQMDRMTGFYIQEAKVQAVAEGEKYGADKAPTKEQIQLAVSTGTPLQPVGDSTTIFGRSAQKASAEIASTSISYAALEELNKVKMDMESGGVSPNAGLQKINAMVSGYSSALSEIDPTAAKKLEAELAYRGNVTYVAATKAAASAAAKQAKDVVEAKLASDFDNITTLIQAGESVDPKTGQVITLDEIRAINRKSFIDQAAKVGGASFAMTVGSKFDTAWKNASKATISFWASDPDGNNVDRLRQLRTGQIEDKSIAALWKSSDITEKDAIFQAAIDRANKAYDVDKAAKAKADAKNKDKLAELTDNFYWYLNKNDKSNMEETLQKLNQLDGGSETANKLRKLTEPDKKVIDDFDTIKEFNKAELNDTLTESRVLEAFNDKRIDNETFRSYVTRIQTRKNEDYKSAKEWLKVKTNFYQTFDRGAAEQKIAEIEQAFASAQKSDPTLKPQAFFESQFKTTNQSVNNNVMEEASSVLRRFATDYGVSPKDNKYNLNKIQITVTDLIASSKLTQEQQNALIKAINTLKAQGLKEF